MSKIKPLKGLSLLDIAFLNESGLYDGFEMQELIKRHGSLERNLTLHIDLLNKIPEIHKGSILPGIKSERPFQLLLKKIIEIENRIDKFISLMLETGIELPDSIYNYVRLKDLLNSAKNIEPTIEGQISIIDDTISYYTKKGCSKAQVKYVLLFELTKNYIRENPKQPDGKDISIRKAVIKVFNDNKDKFPSWAESSLNKYYHNGQDITLKF